MSWTVHKIKLFNVKTCLAVEISVTVQQLIFYAPWIYTTRPPPRPQLYGVQVVCWKYQRRRTNRHRIVSLRRTDSAAPRCAHNTRHEAHIGLNGRGTLGILEAGCGRGG